MISALGEWKNLSAAQREKKIIALKISRRFFNAREIFPVKNVQALNFTYI